jgi:hypothetical protein
LIVNTRLICLSRHPKANRQTQSKYFMRPVLAGGQHFHWHPAILGESACEPGHIEHFAST